VVPKWVSKHYMFPKVLNEVLEPALPLAQDPMVAIEELREALSLAGQLLLRKTADHPPSSKAQLLSWLFGIARAVRAGNLARVQKAGKAVPQISRYLNLEDGSWINEAGFYSYIQTVARGELDRELSELEVTDMAPAKKGQRRSRLLGLCKAWSPKNRKVALTGILDGGSNPIMNHEDGAKELARHWGQVHTPIRPDHEKEALFLEHVQPAASSVTWELSQEQVFQVIDKLHDSAPGPDGLPYSMWTSNIIARETIYQLYTYFLRGGEASPTFNHCLTVYIPKGTDPQDHLERWRQAETTRPISLSDSINNIIAILMNMSLAEQAAISTLYVQRGFVKGRDMNDNIVKIEGHHITQFLRDNEKAGCA